MGNSLQFILPPVGCIQQMDSFSNIGVLDCQPQHLLPQRVPECRSECGVVPDMIYHKSYRCGAVLLWYVVVCGVRG